MEDANGRSLLRSSLMAKDCYTRTASCTAGSVDFSIRLRDFDLDLSVRERLRLRRDREREDLDLVLRLLFSSPSSIKSYSPLRDRDRLRLRREEPDRLLSDRVFLSFSEFIRRIIARKNRADKPRATTMESNLRTFFATSSGVFPKAEVPFAVPPPFASLYCVGS